MAKQLKKLADFWNGYRKECRLINYQALVSKGDEKRIKLSVEIKLSNQNNRYMPDRFVPLFGLMEKEDSTTNLAKEALMCDGMTVDLFATTESEKPTKSISACTLQDFKLVGEGEKDKRNVALEFIVYMPADRVLNEWAFGHLHKTFYLEAVPSQQSLPLEDAKPGTSVVVVPPAKAGNGKPAAKADSKAKKSGPADLKAFQDQQAGKGKSGPVAVQ